MGMEDTGIITHSENLVKCPECGKTQKATGEHYFLCCRHRHPIDRNRVYAESEEDSNRGHKQDNSTETQQSRKSENKPESNPESGSNRSGDRGDTGKSLEFV